MVCNEVRRPIIRLATAVLFMVAALAIPNLRAQEVDTCSEVTCPNVQWGWGGVWPENPNCHTWLYYCPPPAGPYHSACDVCYE